ncbi:MAG: B12-binding domain-containing radical SAM protein [Elusimicrobia bacterium]|nr:B12-binding domain-containing radical SAM protein [Elusimicrobiota bacterium]
MPLSRTSDQRIVFLQLPRLDPDVSMPGENVMLAAAGLQHALRTSRECAAWSILPTPAEQDSSDNAVLADAIVKLEPTVVACTVYLWNVERSIRLLGSLKKRLPRLRAVVGGPEVSRDHPLLGPAAGIDVEVAGEGETVFPDVLAALRQGRATDWRGVGWRRGRTLAWGKRAAPTRPLAELLPPAEAEINRPDAHGMAYLETNRGCPMRCAFCCYNLLRRGWSSLPPAETERRIRVLRRRGVREIRLVDPTFNAHRRFRATLAAMRRANADKKVRFFVEIRADTLTAADAAALAAANVTEAEVGVQSTDPAVLRRIHRPARLDLARRGIELLIEHGIKPTIDFMYGLPGQGLDDLSRCLAWLEAFPEAHQQFLPTLLLPGTELRERCRELGLRGQSLPPYRVLATDRLSSRRLAAVEADAERRIGGFDSPTRCFVGRRLPDLFPERVRGFEARGSSNRRAAIFSGADLFARREAITGWMKKAVRREPDILWQFVFAPQSEEPLDLLVAAIAAVRRMPGHWLDRMVSPAGTTRFAARRVLMRLPRNRTFDPGWRAAVEGLLASVFH